MRIRGKRSSIIAAIAAAVTVPAVCLCCISLFSISAENVPETVSSSETVKETELIGSYSQIEKIFARDNENAENVTWDNYSKWLSRSFSVSVITREEWISMLFDAYDIKPEAAGDKVIFDDQRLYSCSDAFVAAYENGFIPGSSAMSPYSALTRGFVAHTIVGVTGYKAEGYNCVDSATADQDMLTALHYGWFTETDEGLCGEDEIVSLKEAKEILGELQTFERLKGKTVAAFGDSIMFGAGNNNVGIADLIAGRYKMKLYDYSENGASFVNIKDRPNILKQIKKAYDAKISPDIILIDGGTNDMANTELGKMSEGFDYKKGGYTDFSHACEYAMGALYDYFRGAEVLYIRAHNMKKCADDIERAFGERALEICSKWRVDSVDIYSDTAFNSETRSIRDRYTYGPVQDAPDSIHPNIRGYGKYYLPAVIGKLTHLI